VCILFGYWIGMDTCWWFTNWAMKQHLENVNAQCSKVTFQFFYELQHQFYNYELITMGIVYPHYWVKHHVKANFKLCLTTSKNHFAMPRIIGPMFKKWCDVMLDGITLDNQSHLFIQTMKNNCIEIMDMDKNDCNHLQLGIKLGVSWITIWKCLIDPSLL